MAQLLRLSADMGDASERSGALAGDIASEFVNARVAAFGRANRMLRLCRLCLDREIAARRMVTVPRRPDAAEFADPMRTWCFLCGTLAPTLPAVPRAARVRRTAA